MENMKEKLKKIIKDNYKGVLILLFIFVLFNYKLNVSIYTPGGLINLNNRIISKDKIYDTKGSINMTYVNLVKGTIPTYLLAKILPTWDIMKNEDITYDSDGDVKKTIDIDKYHLEESISNAYMVAYDTAGVNYNIKNTKNYVVYIYENADTDLELFDNIKKYDNIEFTTFKSMQEYITYKNVGDTIHFIVERNGKIINCKAKLVNIDGSAKVGISAVIINEYDSDTNITIKSKDGESGSSGGFMMTLAIYNALTKKDITKGLTVAGTGTIDSEGNVGVIGGVKYKLSGAVKNKADVFLVPKDNYKEAYEYKNKNNFKIKIKSIDTFKNAIDYLNNLEG